MLLQGNQKSLVALMNPCGIQGQRVLLAVSRASAMRQGVAFLRASHSGLAY